MYLDFNYFETLAETKNDWIDASTEHPRGIHVNLKKIIQKWNIETMCVFCGIDVETALNCQGMSANDPLDVPREIKSDFILLFYKKYLVFNKSSSNFSKNVLKFF